MTARFGHRAVSLAGLVKKAGDLLMAKGWHDFDEAVVCRDDDSGTPGPGSPVRPVRFIKFHHRAVACYSLALYYFHSAPMAGMPPWLTVMAQTIRCKNVGPLPRTEAIARGMGLTAFLTEGAVKVSWLETVLMVRGNGSSRVDAATLEAAIRKVCPEHADQINDWGSLRNLVNRCDHNIWILMEDIMGQEGLMVPPLPQKWFRDILLPVKEKPGDVGFTAEVQVLTVRRWLGCLLKIKEEQGLNYENLADLHAAWRLGRTWWGLHLLVLFGSAAQAGHGW